MSPASAMLCSPAASCSRGASHSARPGLRPRLTGAPLLSTGFSARPRPSSSQTSRAVRQSRVVLAAAEAEPEAKEASADEATPNWVPCFPPEELPKGVRKEVVVDGLNILLFWYRNEIFAIQARSPSEGAFSEGFMQSRFTQDYGIECPATGSVFSLKNGEILDWYPNNPVLRVLTPAATCRPMEVYPVKLTQEAVMVDVANGSQGGVASTRTRGGSDTSLENNNVFGVEPIMYLEGTDPSQPLVSSAKKTDINPATAVITLLAVAIISVAGSAWFVVNENLIGLGLFWAVGFGIVGTIGYNYTKEDE